jgi:hypothetical protein
MVATNYNTATSVTTIAATAAGDSATVAYTCPTNHDATIDLILLSNNNAGAKKINIQWYDLSSTTYYYILKAHSIAANSTYNVLDSSLLHIHAGDKIVLYGETTNTIESSISVKEYFSPTK